MTSEPTPLDLDAVRKLGEPYYAEDGPRVGLPADTVGRLLAELTEEWARIDRLGGAIVTPYVIGSYGPVEITSGRRRWFRRRRYLASCALCRNGYITRSSADAWDIARDHTCARRPA